MSEHLTHHRHDARLFRMEGRLTELVTVGLLPEGIRMHNTFAGTIVAGEPAGALVRGVDEFVIRPDGTGVVDAREVVISEAGTLTEANAVITSPVVGAANSRDIALACDDGSDEVCISEFQVGLQYERCLACVAANLFCRVALEYQYWDTGDLYATSSSYAFLQGGYPEFAGRVDASADAHDGDLDLIGLALRVGLDY